MPGDRTARWQDVGAEGEFPDGSVRPVYVGEHVLAIGRDGALWFALSNTCPHAGGSLGHGFVKRGRVICPLHMWAFDARTGECEHRGGRVTPFPIRVENGRVEVQA
jgi:nitrite reductase (NADH) small subunit